MFNWLTKLVSPSSSYKLGNLKDDQATLPPLTDTDYEFLFGQLLEGVIRGWHPVKINEFFQKLGSRGDTEQWLTWMQRYGDKLLTAPKPDRALATKMIRFGEQTKSQRPLQPLGDLAATIGQQLMTTNRDSGSGIWEYAGEDISNTVADLTTPPEMPSLPEQGEALTLDELLARLHQDPNLVNAIAQQLGISSNDPQEIFNILLQQINQIQNVELNPDAVTDTPSEDTLSPWDTETADVIQEQTEITSEDQDHQTIIQDTSEIAADSQDHNPMIQDSEITADNQLETPIIEDTREIAPEIEFNQTLIEDTREIAPEIEFNQTLIEDTREIAPEIEFNQTLIEDTSAIAVDNQVESPMIEDTNEIAPEIQTNNTVIQEEVIITEETTGKQLDLEGWFNLGLEQAESGNFETAIASWQQALQFNPNIAAIWHNLGSALGHLGKFQEAISSFDQATHLDPYDYEIWRDRGYAFSSLGQWQSAIDSWQQSLNLESKQPDLWYNLGYAYENIGQIDNAISNYRQTLQLNSEHPEANIRLQQILGQ